MESKEEERRPMTDEESIAHDRLNEKIGNLNFDGVDAISVKCILRSNNGGKTWTLFKQQSDILVSPGEKLASLEIEGIELWDINSDLEKVLGKKVLKGQAKRDELLF